MAKKNEVMSPVEKIGAGVGLTAAAVAAAGAYFLYGSKSAAKNRKAVKSWALKAKAEILERLEDAKEMTQEEYEQMIASVSGVYASVKKALKGEIADFKKEMMENWKAIEKVAKPKKAAKKVPAKKVAAKKVPAKK